MKGMRGAILLLLLSACVPTAALDNAPCPCLSGYTCAEGNVCKSEAALVSGLIGMKYIVNIRSEQWTLPPNLAEQVAPDGQTYPVFAFEIMQADPASMEFEVRVATVNEGVQDARNRTYRMQGELAHATDTGLAFTLVPMDIQSILFGPTTNTLAIFYNFTLAGNFVDQGRNVANGSLTTVMKANEIYKLFYMAQSPSGEDFCAKFLAYTHYSCEACPGDGSVPLCLPFEARGLSFPSVPDLRLVEVANFDPTVLP